MSNPKTRALARCGLVAAIYTVLGIVFAPIAFGAVQLRIPEALALLPVLSPVSAWGVALGCAITNLIGASTGANFLGMADVFIGGGATLIAAVTTAKLGKYRWHGLPLVASIPPVLLNAVVIGAEWSFVTTGSIAPLAVLPFAGLVAAGQFLSCTVLGVALVCYMERSGVAEKIFGR